ncbi:histidine kinase [Ascidiimonas sp. W6]|uniref:histidine kinase n=1 Tax=Ascidiimonas meishanensis TaxID=3128903 RepID=UPI0030EF7D1C
MRFYISILVFLLCTLCVYAQPNAMGPYFQIKGSVKGQNNYEPISGVDVYVLGGAQTRTNYLGEFTIKVHVNDILVISSPEFKTVRYTIKNKEDIDVLVKGYQFSSVQKESKSRSRQDFHKKWVDSAVYFKRKDIDKSIGFIEKSLQSLGKRGDDEKSALSFKTLGDIYSYYKQYDLAISNYKTSLNLFNTLDARIQLAKNLLLNSETEAALSEFNGLIKSAELSAFQKVVVYEGLGDVYRTKKNLNAAIENYQKGLGLANKNLIKPKITDLNSKIAKVYSVSNDVAEAEGFYSNSLELAKKENPKRSLQEQERVADFYNEKNLYDKEIKLRKETLESARKLKRAATAPATQKASVEEDSITTQKINYKIANAFIAQDKYDEAIPYLEESIAEADEEDDLIVQKDATRRLSEVYRTVGDYYKALESYQNYVKLVDSLYVKKEQEISRASRFSRDVANKQNRISSLEKDRELSVSKFELAIKDQQLIKESNKRQKIIIYSLIFGMFLLALVAILSYRTNQQQKLSNNLLALKSLRSQMNPHFIFNALNSVNTFIARSDERSANRYLTDFSALMRAVLENSEEDFIPLSKEIELLKLYTKLEHSRFEEKFDYEINIDTKVKVADFQIPPMLLQPYIENAIWHGLRYKKEKGHLKINVVQPDIETVQISIEDNGIGRRKSQELKTENQKKQKSKGMGNIKKRIAILNDMYKDKIDVSIEDLSSKAFGTRVILTLKKD